MATLQAPRMRSTGLDGGVAPMARIIKLEA